MPVLSHDVEQAVQHAIGLANNVLGVVAHEKSKSRKSKKRKHLSEPETDAQQEGLLPKKKKKKSKKDVTAEGQELPEIVAGGPFDTNRAHDPEHLANIDPALQNIRSTRSTQELVAELTRAGEIGDVDEIDMPSLAELFADQGESSENLLRVLSELDLPKLTSALNTLTQSGATVAGPSMPGILAPPATTLQSAVASTSYANAIPMPPMPTKRVVNKPQRAPSPENKDHAYILANKWMSATKLNQLEKSHGIAYKKGKFSALEDQEIMRAIEDYRLAHNMTLDEIRNVIKKDRTKKGARDPDTEGFWFEITAKLELRPVIAVYHHVRRLYDAKRRQGKWLPEEDTALENAVTELGPKWEDISERVGRTGGDCRDRWRNHLENRTQRVSGQWSEEEEQLLTQIVHEMTVNRGVTADNDVFWSQVSAKMGSRRTRQQCRIKWYDALNKKVKNEGVKPRWGSQDAFILIHKVASLDVNDESEIDWKRLGDDDWNLWSAHQLQRRFRGLLRSVKGYESMPFSEIMEILKAKQQGPPTSPKKPRSERKMNISREFVDDEETANRDESNDES